MHINCQFRDPLGPVEAEWNPERDLRGLGGWDTSSAPFTSSGVGLDASSSSSVGVYGGAERAGISGGGGGGVFGELAALVRSAKRGLLVVAGGGDASDALAAAAIARTLGWAVAADAASGLRVKGAPQSDTTGLEWSPATGRASHYD